MPTCALTTAHDRPLKADNFHTAGMVNEQAKIYEVLKERELCPRVAFIVTNLETDSLAVVRFYNKRGTAEQWIKDGKQAVKMTRLSCHRFRWNEVRLWLSAVRQGNAIDAIVHSSGGFAESEE